MTVQIPVWVVLLIPATMAVVAVLAVWALGDRGANRTQSPAFRPAATATFTPTATKNLALAAGPLNRFFTKPGREWIVPVAETGGFLPGGVSSDGALQVGVTNPGSGTASVKVRFFDGLGRAAGQCNLAVQARHSGGQCGLAVRTGFGEWARVTSNRQVYVSASVNVRSNPVGPNSAAAASYPAVFPVQAFEVR